MSIRPIERCSTPSAHDARLFLLQWKALSPGPSLIDRRVVEFEGPQIKLPKTPESCVGISKFLCQSSNVARE
jgi:hypothetical protein